MKIRTQLITGFSLIFVLVVMVQIVEIQTDQSTQESEDLIHHTHTVMSAAEKIAKLMVDMETGERGYLLTGDETFLEPYNQAVAQREDAIDHLVELVTHDQGQVQRLVSIEKLIMRWIQEVATPLIQRRRSAAVDEPEKDAEKIAEIRAIVRSSAGKDIVDAVRQRVGEFIDVEEARLVEQTQKTDALREKAKLVRIAGMLGIFLVSVIITISVSNTIYRKVGGEPDTIARLAARIGEGDLEVDISDARQTGIMAAVINMQRSLKRNHQEISAKSWHSDSLAGLADTMRGTKGISVLCDDIIGYLARQLDLQVGTFSLADDEHTELSLAGSYAYKGKQGMKTTFGFGEGLIGQAAQSKKFISIQDIPDDTITITSALGEIPPANIYCLPLIYDEAVIGVIELGSLRPITDMKLTFLKDAAERIAIAIHTTRSREKMQTLLEESQSQSEELQAQAEELQTQAERLETQQEELRVTNEELQEKISEQEMKSDNRRS